jgi:cobalt-precorrin-5B (C1)-methyltransferase
MTSRKDLRSGYTTGACAAAASAGALLALLRQQAVAEAAIRLPAGTVVRFSLHSCSFSPSEGRASVIKDAGDDPDVTHQAEICARVRWSAQPGVMFQRGPGVGLVTRKGLPVPPGEPAINPAPRRLIADTLAEILAAHPAAASGLEVEISVPNGEELARKTFNPRLGIVGGISILGTTGIVIPYSTSAWRASVTQAIDVAAAAGMAELVLTVGARGERLARNLFPLPQDAFIQIGPFFGDALRHCLGAGIRSVILAAMIGKLSKFAAGHDSVHSTSSKQDFEFLAGLARSAGASPDNVQVIAAANTAQEVADFIAEHGPPDFFSRLCAAAWESACKVVQGKMLVDVVLMSNDGRVLARHSG